MRRLGPISTVLCLLAVACSLSLPDPSEASPSIELSWNRCDAASAQPVLGADRKARLYVLLQGLSADLAALTIRITIQTRPKECGCSESDGATVPPAWSFEPGGCQGPDRVTSTFGPGAAGCSPLAPPPSFAAQSTSRDSAFCVPGSCGSAHEVLTLDAAAVHPWALQVQDRVAVWQVDFDLSASCSYSGGNCCPDGGPLLLHPSGTAWLTDGSNLDLTGTSVTYSPNAVSTKPATWGRLKANYR